MRLFNKKKKKEEKGEIVVDCIGKPNFYEKKDGSLYGAFAITEGILTSLPKNPDLKYKVDGKEISEWKLKLVSSSSNSELGNLDYKIALEKLKIYCVSENSDSIFVKRLSSNEINSIL